MSQQSDSQETGNAKTDLAWTFWTLLVKKKKDHHLLEIMI